MNSDLPVVDCHGCGVCCLHMGFPAFNLSVEIMQSVIDNAPCPIADLGEVAKADLSRWRSTPSELQQELLNVIRGYEPPESGELDGPCIWLDPDSRLCRHHLHRPQVCRDFEIGCQQCLDWREHYADLVKTNDE